MADEGLFRLIALRSASAKPIGKESPWRFPLFESADGSDLLDRLREPGMSAGALESLRKEARSFRTSDRYIDRVEEAKGARSMLDWFEEHERELVSSLDPDGVPVDDDLRLRAADSLLADAVLPADDTVLNGARKALLFKLLSLRTKLEASPVVDDETLTLGECLARAVVLIPRLGPTTTTPPTDEPADPRPEPDPQQPGSTEGGSRERLDRLTHVHRSLLHLATSGDAVEVDPGDDPPADPKQKKGKAEREPGASRLRLRFRKDALEQLDEEARKGLEEVGVDVARIDPLEAVRRLETEIEREAASVPVSAGGQRYLAMEGVSLNMSRLAETFGWPGGIVPTAGGGGFPFTLGRCQQSVGVGDLLIVKQALKAYEVTEFAHVENVLAGEKRVREHRRLVQREEIVTRESETTTETERDLQTTDRSELQNEVESTLQTETGLEAGLQISGSYGPSISFTSNIGATFRASTEESERKAVEFSREVVEKTAERVRERVREQRVVRTLEETEELNRHRFANDGAEQEHIRGIYRWLNKIYDAQVLRYGQRMMFEFVVPEPAAFYLYALLDNPPENLVLEKPEPPTFGDRPLQPGDLDETNYKGYVSQYAAGGVKPPPPSIITTAFFAGEDAADQDTLRILGRTSKIEVPPGYEAYAARVHFDFTRRSGESYQARVRIGGVTVSTMGAHYRDLTSRTRGELAVSMFMDDVFNFAVGIDVYCERTPEGLAEWQLETFEAIMEAYQREKARYEDNMRVEAMQEGVPALGRNPLENRRVERNELKKLVMFFLTGGRHMGENVFLPGMEEPVPDVGSACELGRHIQFMEHAFEWRNMQYLFYPYFWGRRARWTMALHLTDPDPDFAAFLTSGAARVQVPVRPGFERAVAYFAQFGEPYEGEDPPLIEDDLYVPIVEEIAENLGREAGGVPYPEGAEPWEVRVPTELVLLQELAEVPRIRDVLSGEFVTIDSSAD